MLPLPPPVPPPLLFYFVAGKLIFFLSLAIVVSVFRVLSLSLALALRFNVLSLSDLGTVYYRSYS